MAPVRAAGRPARGRACQDQHCVRARLERCRVGSTRHSAEGRYSQHPAQSQSRGTRIGWGGG